MGPEVRAARIVEAIGRSRRDRSSGLAAAVVAMGARHYRAPRERYAAAGAKRQSDLGRGRASARAVRAARAARAALVRNAKRRGARAPREAAAGPP